MSLVKKKATKLSRNSLNIQKLYFGMFDGVANWIFPKKSHSYKMKCQIGTFHELLPGNLVFFHFYYIGTKEIQHMDHTIEFSIKNYIIDEIFSNGGQFLSKTFRDQTVINEVFAYGT